MKKLVTSCIIAGCVIPAAAKLNYSSDEGKFIIGSDKNKVTIEWYSPSIVRICRQPVGAATSDKKSLAVTATPDKVKIKTRTTDSSITMSSDRLSVIYDTASDRVSLTDRRTGEVLLSEKPASALFTPTDDHGRNTFSISQTFLPEDGEPVFGLGQHRHGLWNQRGSSQHLSQENMEIAIPLIQSPKGYALYWDNYSATDFSDNDSGMTFASRTGDMIDYYFIYGGDSDATVAGLRKLTGLAPMFPLWSYGFHQSRERYMSQDELVGTVRRYRELGVPLDGIIQDWQYWGENNRQWNAVRFLNPKFPDPAGMIDSIHSLNAHATISIWPSFGPDTDIYKQLESEDKLMAHKTYPQDGDTRVYNPYDQRARDIYWSYFKDNMTSIGMDGWWLDATEPEHSPIEESDYDYETGMGTFRSVRNAFPLVSVGGIYDNHRRDYDGKRVFILTRSAFAGQQRYGAQSWSGDIEASWTTLRNQIPAALNFSLCGIPYWNSDIGGFYTWREYPDGIKDPAYRELYTRWMQFGAFTGMMRSHGTNCPREIYQFGQPGDSIYDAQLKAINLRYRFLPYIYSTAWKITNDGASLMRPLYADFADDSQAIMISDQYLFGQSVMVAPVVQPSSRRNVYLPAGCDWIDFWDGRCHKGGHTIETSAPIDIIPLYIRCGTILPIGPQVQYATEKPWDDLELRIYPGADAEFTLYEDEGDNYNYEHGHRSLIRMKWDDRRRILTINDREGSFDGIPANRKFRVTMVGSNDGIGINEPADAHVLEYTGSKTRIKL